MNAIPDDPRTDTDLITAANGGDRRAFETIYLRHREWAVSLAYRFTHDREGALDVMQETFLHLLGRFPGFELRANLRTYLYPVVRNTALTHRRKTDRQETGMLAFEAIESTAESNPGAETDRLEGVAQVIHALPTGQREVVLLRFMDGLSLGEIAESLALPLGTVKSRLHNALGTMRSDDRTRSYFLE